VTLLVAIVTGLWQLYKHFSDRTAMRKRRQILCDELRDHLGRIDSETNWSHRHFVPLDAEVEVLKDDHKRRRIMDLFAGIRTNRRSLMFHGPGRSRIGECRRQGGERRAYFPA
jgi:hypothetical protein